jgi:hypothetical protein
VIAAMVAVLVGALVLADLAPRPPLRRMVTTHVAVALAGTVVLCVAAFGDSPAVAWVAVAVLVGAVALGLRAYRRSIALGSAGPSGEEGAVAGAASSPVSPAVLMVHGGAATAVVLLTLMVALKVG